MQIYILSEKMKALKNFIFLGFKEGRRMGGVVCLFLIFMVEFSLAGDFLLNF